MLLLPTPSGQVAIPTTIVRSDHWLGYETPMRSMTGFGSGRAPLGEGRVTLEVRTVNHRYLDVRVQLPPALSAHAFFLEQSVRQQLSRGHVDISARTSGSLGTGDAVDAERARAAFRALAALRDELAPGQELSIDALTAVPDLFVSTVIPDADAARSALRSALDQALVALTETRCREGEALAKELRLLVAEARQHRAAIATHSELVVAAHAQRLKQRIERQLSKVDVNLDSGRLEAEIAILSDKSDISEELGRLQAHFDALEAMFASDEAVGRKLDFMLQEVGREANTIGSKSQDAALAHHVVDLKTTTERLRQQVQNIE